MSDLKGIKRFHSQVAGLVEFNVKAGLGVSDILLTLNIIEAELVKRSSSLVMLPPLEATQTKKKGKK